jgi:hypothetical protein
VKFALCVVRPQSRLPCPTISTFIWCWTISESAAAAGASQTDRETIITDLMRGEFNCPLRAVAFNNAEASSRDESEYTAEEILQRLNAQAEYRSAHLEAFFDRHSAGKPLQLPLPLRGAA